MSPLHSDFTRIPLHTGSELRIRNNGEIAVGNPVVGDAPAHDAASAVIDYRYDSQSGEHVIRLVEPAVRPGAREV